jgi:hypothetical protein
MQPKHRRSGARGAGLSRRTALPYPADDLTLCRRIGFPENRIPLFGPML